MVVFSLIHHYLTSCYYIALSPKKIQEFFIPIVKLAKRLLNIHKAKKLEGINEPPVVTVSDSLNNMCISEVEWRVKYATIIIKYDSI